MALLDKTGVERLWLHVVSNLNKKVDKIEGKGLSTNDYTTEEKNQLATLGSLIGDTSVSEQINEALNNMGGEPFKQLVTDKDGKAVWEERLAYEIPASETIWEYTTEMPEGSGGIGEGITEPFAKDLIVGETYRVKVNNDEYSYVAYLDESGLFKAIGTQDDIVRIMQYIDHPELYGYIDLECEPGAVTISVAANSGVSYKTVDPKWLPEGIGYETDVLPEIELTMSEEMGGGLVLTPFDSKLVAGDTYTVVYNGAEYRCVAKEFSEGGETAQILGNFDLMTGTGDTGEPFVFIPTPDAMVAEMGCYGVCYALDGAEAITLAISGGVHKIDPKYLPEGIGYETESTLTTYLEKSTCIFDEELHDMVTVNTLLLDLHGGQTYNVIYNEELFQCTAIDAENVIAFGNPNLHSDDSGLPFLLMSEGIKGSNFLIYSRSGYSPKTIEITLGEEGTIHKIDPKFLPEGIGYEIEGTFVEVWPKNSTIASDMNGSYITVPAINNLEVGKEYTVIINDNKYITTAYSMTENGQTATAIGAMPPTDETPFIIVLWPEPDEVMLQYDGASDEVVTAYGKGYIMDVSDFGPAVGTIQVYTGEEGTIHKIDPKFLPEGIGYEINEGGEEILPTSSCVADGAYYNVSGPYLGFGFDETYVFTYNGKDYTLTTRLYNENIRWTVVGKFNEDDGFEENVPFGIIFAEKENWEKTGVSLSIIPYPQNSEDIPMTLAIRREGNHSIHKIDPKYLPEGIGYGDPNEVILPETELEAIDEDGDGLDDLYVYTSPLGVTLVAGETYVVNYNGTEYESTAVSFGEMMPFPGVVGLGNIDILMETGDNGLPFAVMVIPDAVMAETNFSIMGAPLDGATSVMLSIAKGSTIHKIDPKYLGEIQEDNSYKQLVTDKDGNTVWEEKLAYEDPDTVIEFLPETILTIDSGSTDALNFITKPFTAPLVAGEKYDVNWNGVNYECIAIETSGAIRVGKYDDSTEPFLIDYVLEPEEITGSNATIMLYGVVAAYDGSEIVNVSITQKKSGTIHKIDPKYIDIDINSIVTQVAAALGLPVPTAADAGKILRVNAEGKYELVSLPNAEEATF